MAIIFIYVVVFGMFYVICDTYRMFIWRSVLRLPENHAAYAALVDKGTHPAFDKLNDEYPIKSRRLLRILQRYFHLYLSFLMLE